MQTYLSRHECSLDFMVITLAYLRFNIQRYRYVTLHNDEMTPCTGCGGGDFTLIQSVPGGMDKTSGECSLC